MNARRFVSGSSFILAGWLGATFFNEVPSQRYPKLDKKPATAAVSQVLPNPSLLAGEMVVLPKSGAR